jgi:hypothetical protein
LLSRRPSNAFAQFSENSNLPAGTRGVLTA